MTQSREKRGISRRRALKHLGVSLSALSVGCVGGESMIPLGDETGGPDAYASPPDLAMPKDLDELLPQTPKELLAGIDAVVVLMMENRSFDHYLGTMQSDARYPGSRRPSGLSGNESNPDGKGNCFGMPLLARSRRATSSGIVTPRSTACGVRRSSIRHRTAKQVAMTRTKRAPRARKLLSTLREAWLRRNVGVLAAARTRAHKPGSCSMRRAMSA